MTISVEEIQAITAHGKVVTEGGDTVGNIGQVYLDDSTGNPSWVTAKTGLFGTAESFVPLEGARVQGDTVVVAFDKETIKDAPRVDADGSITPAQEQELYRYYGLQSPGSARTDDDRSGRHDRADLADRSAGHDTSGPNTDDAMTRSEEQLRVGTQTRESGRAVLRKYVVTEYVTQTVPVRREEVRLEHEPITDANRGDVVDQGVVTFDDDGSDVFEIVLHQEVPVVKTETVAVERVRLRKLTVTDQTTVSDDVRKEQIELDDPTQSPRNP